MSVTQHDQTDRNYDAFMRQLPGLLGKHTGSFALIHDCSIVDFYTSSLDATIAGAKRFGPGEYSVQEVAEQPEHLGFYSYVGGSGAY